VGQKSKPQIFIHIFTKCRPIFKIFTPAYSMEFHGKFVTKWLLNLTPRLNCVATLHREI